MIRPPADPVKTDSAPGIIYILGSGHSGSTLLSLLLTSHSQVTGVGELKALSPSAKWSSQERAEGPCTCGAPTLRHCAFWRRLDAAVTELAGCSVWEVDLDSEDPAVFATHNLAVFRAIATITGRHWIVDSSKNVGRLEKLIAARLVDVRPVRLIRSASGVVYSNVKRGRPWLPRARAYIRNAMGARRAVAGKDHLVVRYESLAALPRQTVAEVMGWLGLAFEDQQLNWVGQEHHDIAGNRMRFSKSNEIRFDAEWKTGLTQLQKLAIAWMTFPMRWSGTWLYALCPPIWELRGFRKQRTGAVAPRS